MKSNRKCARALTVPIALAVGLVMTAAEAHPLGHGPERNNEKSFSHEPAPKDGRLAALEKMLAANPTDEKAAAAYARYAAQQARRFGDTDLLRRAESALLPWERVEQPPIDILIVRANLKQINHRFHDALADLEIVLARQPSNPQALLSRAFIRATIGRAKSGMADCAALKPNVSIVIRETCAARLGGLAGALEASHRRMGAVLQIAPAANMEERRFALAVAAEIAQRMGADRDAAKYYSELLSADPVSAFARAAYSDFLLSKNDNDAALQIIGDTPHTEALLLVSALAGRDLDSPIATKSAQELGARMAADRIAGDFSHAREYARFALDYLNDPKLALLFAQENWRVQKEPVDARILARSAKANNALAIIGELNDWLNSSALEDPELERLLERRGN